MSKFPTITNPTLNAKLAKHFSVEITEVIRVQEWAQVWWVHIKNRRPTLVSKKVVIFEVKPHTKLIEVTEMRTSHKLSGVFLVDWKTQEKTDLRPVYRDSHTNSHKATYEIDLTYSGLVVVQDANYGHSQSRSTWYVIKNGVMSAVDGKFLEAAMEFVGVDTSMLGIGPSRSKSQADYAYNKVWKAIHQILCKTTRLQAVVNRINHGIGMDTKSAIEKTDLCLKAYLQYHW